FQTHEVALEEAKMQVALLLFNERLQAFQDELQTNADAAEAAPLLEDTRTVQQFVAGMATEAQRLFAYLRNQQPREAGESMAAMDREHAQANAVLEHLRDEIAAIQKRHFENQTALATSLQRFQYAVSALILLLIGGAAVFAHRVRRQLEAATR